MPNVRRPTRSISSMFRALSRMAPGSMGSLVTGRISHTATLLPNGKVLATGGQDNNSGALASAELYDPASGTWTATGSLATARYFHTATLLPNGKVLVAGGLGDFDFLASAELYVSDGVGGLSLTCWRNFLQTATSLTDSNQAGTFVPLGSSPLSNPRSTEST